MDQVSDRHHRVMPDHARSGVAHHFSDPLPHIHFVAMDCAVLAGGFFNPEGTLCQPFLGVLPKLNAFLAKWIAPMVSLTEYLDHRQQCGAFLFDFDHETSKFDH
jgi:hypothetical protein